MKKTKYLLLALLSVMTLTSCDSFWNYIHSQNSQPSFHYTPTNSEAGDDLALIDNNEFVMPNATGGLNNYFREENNPYSNTALQKEWGVAPFKSTGNQKMLIVPVSFTDFDLKNSDIVVEDLRRAFFGSEEETPWESVTSFYKKSSYNKLNISGEVLTPLNLGMTRNELSGKEVNDRYWDQTHYVLEKVYSLLPASKLKEYDTDNDGHVDSVFIIYLAPASRNSDVFWAYQYFWNMNQNINKPTFSTYAWASYSFMYEDQAYGTTRPASHTYIHETGHMFGLNDYYDYDGSTNPAGGYEMMDNNIQDNNMYSKFVNNWATPYVVYGDADVRLEPATTSGDFLIINNKWNGHAYDEYIMLEYYTPNGLNAKDSVSPGYTGNKGLNESGLRIYHIDSRLIYTDYASSHMWSDQILPSTNVFSTTIASTNTQSDNVVSSLYRQVHLLDAEARTTTWFHTSIDSDNKSLFKPGDKIEANEWGKYLLTRRNFNDGEEIGYSLEVKYMDMQGITISLRSA